MQMRQETNLDKKSEIILIMQENKQNHNNHLMKAMTNQGQLFAIRIMQSVLFFST